MIGVQEREIASLRTQVFDQGRKNSQHFKKIEHEKYLLLCKKRDQMDDYTKVLEEIVHNMQNKRYFRS